MLQQISHRGFRSRLIPDRHFSIGHVRLPIQGLSEKFDQPFRGRTLFVGEIFNWRLFGSEYDSDIEMVSDLMENRLREPPQSVFDQMDGSWSIVHVDKGRRSGQYAYVYTDHLAKKPLYVLKEPGTLAICSEILPLLLISEQLEWDHHNLSATAKWGYHPANTTPFKNISKLPPNSRSVINLEYGWLEKTQTYLNWPGKPEQDLRSAIKLAVQNRLVSDIPISMLMSGGLDSTIIYYLMRKELYLPAEFTVFHIDNNEEEYLNYIDFRGVTVKKLYLQPDILNPVLFSNQTPMDLGSMIPQFLLSKAIQKRGYNVAISGDGADELFGGYRRIAQYDSQYTDIFDELVYYHLPRLDRQMMAHTVEIRCPFLAPDVINNALNTPYELRMHKKILKDLFADLVPKPIIDRKKEPLKIKAIHRDKMEWRLSLITKFKKLMEGFYEHQRCV